MMRSNPGHAAWQVISCAVLSLGLPVVGNVTNVAHAATSRPATNRISSTTVAPLTGTLHSATKRALTLMQTGSKKLTAIRLSTQTQYVVKGKLVATQPTFTRGLLISVITAVSKSGYTARTVIVGTDVAPSSRTAGGSPPVVPSGPMPGTMSLTGAVTLTSAVSVTLKTSRGTATIILTSATHYVVKGKTSASKPVLHAGEKVHIVAIQANGLIVGQVFTVS